MAVNLVATLSGANSNSLVTVAQADAHFEVSLSHSEWCGLDNDTKARALIEASRSLDELDLMGEPAQQGQALPFPRVYFPRYDGLSIPREIVQAVCEHALVLAKDGGQRGESRRQRLQREGVTSFRLGDAAETFGAAKSATSTAAALSQFSGRVQRLLSSWTRAGYTLDSGRYPAQNGRYDINGLVWPSELMP